MTPPRITTQQLTSLLHQLFTDAISLGADKLAFELDSPRCGGQKLGFSMTKDREALREACLEPQWFSAIEEYVTDRVAPWVSAGDGRPPTSVIPLGNQSVFCSVERRPKLGGQSVLVIARIRPESHQNCLSLAGFSSVEKSTSLVSKALQGELGTVVLTIPHRDRAQAARSLIATLSPVASILDWSEGHGVIPSGSWGQKGSCTWLLVTGTDPLEALLSIRDTVPTEFLESVGAAFSFGFAREVCPECARDGLIDPQLISQMPPGVWSTSIKNQRVGRRCKACNQTGIKGPCMLVSAVAVDGEFKSALRLGKTEGELARCALQQGFEPLLQVGVRRVQKGETTLEAVCHEVRTILPIYERVRSEASEPLPLKLDFNAASAVPPVPIPAFAEEVKKSSRSLLVVDDDADQRDILALVFQQAGYDVTLALNGKDALKKLEDFRPACIITDLMMPELDGAGLVREVRKNQAASRIPIMVLTVISDGGKEYELFDLGVDDYCEKSVAKRVLLKRVERLLGNAAR